MLSILSTASVVTPKIGVGIGTEGFERTCADAVVPRQRKKTDNTIRMLDMIIPKNNEIDFMGSSNGLIRIAFLLMDGKTAAPAKNAALAAI
jgi:hypothetical protein